MAHASAREACGVADRAAVLVANAYWPFHCGERGLLRRESDPDAGRESDAPHQILPLSPMWPTTAPMPLEDHEVRGLVADDLVTQLRGKIEHEGCNPHQAARGITAAERTHEAAA